MPKKDAEELAMQHLDKVQIADQALNIQANSQVDNNKGVQ